MMIFVGGPAASIVVWMPCLESPAAERVVIRAPYGEAFILRASRRSFRCCITSRSWSSFDLVLLFSSSILLHLVQIGFTMTEEVLAVSSTRSSLAIERLPSVLNSSSLKLMMELVGVADGVTGAEWVSRDWHWWQVMIGWLVGVDGIECSLEDVLSWPPECRRQNVIAVFVLSMEWPLHSPYDTLDGFGTVTHLEQCSRCELVPFDERLDEPCGIKRDGVSYLFIDMRVPYGGRFSENLWHCELRNVELDHLPICWKSLQMNCNSFWRSVWGWEKKKYEQKIKLIKLMIPGIFQ